MKIQDFRNLSLNENLREKLNKIILEMDEDDLEKTYIRCQALLEFINIFLLEKKLNIKMQDYNITRICNEYKKIDEELFNQMISINSKYNTVFENGIRVEDIEYLLSKIDYIYGVMVKKYGDII